MSTIDNIVYKDYQLVTDWRKSIDVFIAIFWRSYWYRV